MKTSRYTEAQILAILRQAEGGMPVAELCRAHGMSSASFYKWRAKYGGMDASLIGQMKADLTLRTVPIMAVTAYAGKGDEEQIRAAGAEAYVSKPISVIKFIESVGAFA